MGWLDQFFKSTANESNENWKPLQSEEELKQLIQRSTERPVAIFKHSIRCGVSSLVLRQLRNNWELPEEQVELYYLDLITYRAVSNQIAAQLQVEHESPQFILLHQGKVVYHASHYLIQYGDIQEQVAALQS